MYKPTGGLYLEGRFNGGFFALRAWGLIFGGDYFWNFTVNEKRWKLVENRRNKEKRERDWVRRGQQMEEKEVGKEVEVGNGREGMRTKRKKGIEL